MSKSESNSNVEILKPTKARSVAVRGLALGCLLLASLASGQSSNDYSAVDSIFAQHCLDCHAAKDPDGQFVLESYEALMKGGELGVAVVPGKSGDSLLVQMIEGRFEKEGKKKIMPPGKRAKLTTEQIGTIKKWIDAGAQRPASSVAKMLNVPKIEVKGVPRNPVSALAFSASSKMIAVGRYGEIELRSGPDLRLVRKLSGNEGDVNAIAFSAAGNELYAAGGLPGWSGEVRRWNVADGKIISTFSGHKDAIYALALSPNGKILATGSYDQKIKLWDVDTGRELKTLSGHNGCIFNLAFRPDGKILASASADRTVKLWDVESGQRRDTLSQSLKEVYAVAFSSDGKRLFAGGADNRIRVWEISTNATETTNPILFSKFGHEGAILKLYVSADGGSVVSSADDQTVKVWNSASMEQKVVLEKQPDWPTAITMQGREIVVGRMDGSIGVYDSGTGKSRALETAALK
jgi:WD40 repeat protein